ncbi:uncharacterized protein ASPGLDRAFT_22848 [Aspergillus glaucus CBS 516.65]|uniref:Uncharacterized protein n=1 Tax=Aspergillus glaucus CBS 516.65 TaxID=1160497 RepID=A0A1L9VVX0_ASPGL|nr:hypothetical protein ASPGLDRAFT_22848 [Aspergillus glaucus CBS 516.65]OJJ88063.1 hypothetical protein ASPGLDRAFT_22848 [Aspergillus glaucus CBS 516.65]
MKLQIHTSSEPSSSELSQLRANIDALTASVAQFRAASEAEHNRLMNSMNELRGEVTGLKHDILSSLDMPADTLASISKFKQEMSSKLTDMDQKLDLLPEVKSQLQDVDRGLENVEDTVDSLKRKIRVASNNVASMIP